jgi:hypothetical protein
MKRRGPPNRHAQRASKMPRLEAQSSPGPQQTAAQALVSIAATQSTTLDAESIAPWQCLVLLVDDFFTYVYPLLPFPHEPSFREALARREDRTNPEFLALMASMVGCLAASFPRSVRAHLKSQHNPGVFPRAVVMVERCRTVALEARGLRFLEKEDVTVQDAATSFFLGLAAGNTMQLTLCRRLLSESLTFLRDLGYHTKRNDLYDVNYRGPVPDNVRDEIGKRIYWALVQASR